MRALNHSEARLLIEQAADSQLTSTEQRLLESHLQGCAECRAYAAEFAALEAAFGKTLHERWGQPKLSKGSEANLVKALQEKFPPGPGSPPKPTGGFPAVLALLGIALIGLLSLGLFWIASATSRTLPTEKPTKTSTATPTTTATLIAEIVALPTDTPTPTVLMLFAIPQQNVNCREGNSSAFEIADTLFEGEEYSPTGRGFDNQWVRFVGPVTQVNCWVFIDNLVLEINEVPTNIEGVPEFLLPFVKYPPTPTPSPTVTFTPERESTATFTPFVPQCSDGIDNDQDRLVDLADKECRSPSDNDEAKP
ncbi:MAG: zf-HC2 domain-containing protein [Chloroflexi bacterium]|nr:zf-HC2 domain-containing protein [Chloroflexota bacterium]